MAYLTSILMAVSLLMAFPAHAKVVKTLGDFTSEQVTLLGKAVNDGTAPESSAGQTRDWAFKRFLLRVTAKVGFSIEVVNLELVPELELVWQKEAAL
jgi:hypothetical protein